MVGHDEQRAELVGRLHDGRGGVEGPGEDEEPEDREGEGEEEEAHGQGEADAGHVAPATDQVCPLGGGSRGGRGGAVGVVGDVGVREMCGVFLHRVTP